MSASNPYGHITYEVRKQLLKLFGGSFRVYDPAGQLVLFASMKAFKLKEDISIFPDEQKSQELLRITARSIIDWSAAYDVFDTPSGQKIGALRRRGWKSMLRDEWVILDVNDQEVGTIQEDNLGLAILRRYIGGEWIPQAYHGTLSDRPVFKFRQKFNPFAYRSDLDFTEDVGNTLDRRLGLAAAILIAAIEGHQE